MASKDTVRREMEVAFSKNAQPLWLRILKYVLLAGLIYFLWGNKWLWIIVVSMLVIALLVHFWYRYKTKGWTKSFGGWKYDKEEGDKDKADPDLP